ncbi:23S rRNA (adenine(1618)-N(6))-methyltransferase RlmF [Roseivirga sp. E12]|uniref:23S rRNA (adenine(1618)-N(6))-methyltransferase RlmF n=1 Tax=Roseivirga sp. E12 TaxID=2819237 RepID=UPI001ABD43D9|nr:23S rRNA (adenine(1618)-N(6))-methyltransferase RlmF [Roseivirga sp. E12]MBO3697801.1 23S rRNA (adenine(1618)-N(6))-methyltransferase RlmF [Roseivirga sp. E12]
MKDSSEHSKPSSFAQALRNKAKEVAPHKSKIKEIKPKKGSKLHPRNKHHGRYDLKQLVKVNPPLAEHIIKNVRNEDTVDFANPDAVRLLNEALLKQHYNLDYWSIPDGYLCPPIPGRADYVHYIADVLSASNFGKVPEGASIKCLDIGVGANCVYPIIGNASYGWSFIGSDIDQASIDSAQKIVDDNPSLKGKVDIRFQSNPKDILYGIIDHEEKVDLVICNPPFHASQEAALEGTLRKLSNLNKKEIKEAKLNFGGQGGELWCEGGERRFVGDLVRESKKFGKSCFWFSSLISKQSNLKAVQEYLQIAGAAEIKVMAMSQGNKASRIIAWTFLSETEQSDWQKSRWKQPSK